MVLVGFGSNHNPKCQHDFRNLSNHCSYNKRLDRKKTYTHGAPTTIVYSAKHLQTSYFILLGQNYTEYLVTVICK